MIWRFKTSLIVNGTLNSRIYTYRRLNALVQLAYSEHSLSGFGEKSRIIQPKLCKCKHKEIKCTKLKIWAVFQCHLLPLCCETNLSQFSKVQSYFWVSGKCRSIIPVFSLILGITFKNWYSLGPSYPTSCKSGSFKGS